MRIIQTERKYEKYGPYVLAKLRAKFGWILKKNMEYDRMVER